MTLTSIDIAQTKFDGLEFHGQNHTQHSQSIKALVNDLIKRGIARSSSKPHGALTKP